MLADCVGVVKQLTLLLILSLIIMDGSKKCIFLLLTQS